LNQNFLFPGTEKVYVKCNPDSICCASQCR